MKYTTYTRTFWVLVLLGALAITWRSALSERTVAKTAAAALGTIAFGPQTAIESDQGIAAIAVGDFSADGIDDFVAISGDFKGNASPLLHWYEGPSITKRVLNSSFFPDSLEEFPGAADTADIDGDGDLDIVLGNAKHGGNGYGEILWFENLSVAQNPNPTGDWPVHVVATFDENAGHMNDIDIDDIDGDGKLDIVMRHLGRAERLRIVFQDNAASDEWTVRSIGDLPSREGMGVADLDSDGDPDILMNGYWLETPANPRTDAFIQHTLDETYFTQPQQGLNNSTKQAFGDINGDGKTDVVLSTAEGQEGWLAWYAQPANPMTEAWPRVRLRTAKALHTLALADFDNDGDLDIMAGGAQSLGEAGLSIWENQNNGQTFVEQVLGATYSAYTGRPLDLDGDGDLDIVAQNHCCRDSGALYWIENLLVDDGEPLPATNTPLPISTPASPTETPPPGATDTPLPPINTPPPASACVSSPVVSYRFTEGSGSTINDVSGNGTPLNLTISSGSTNWLPDGGLSVSSSARIESAGPATKLIDAAKASDELTVELWIDPANITQDGPARILTLAEDGSNRNVTVGQGLWSSQPKDVFDVRMRTSDSSTNDDGKPAVTSPSGTAKVGLTHVVYSRNAAGSATIYVDGVPTVTESRTGTLDNWDDAYRLGLANEFSSNRPWLGTFYEVGLFTCAFSADDAAASYAAGLGDEEPTPATPVPATPIPATATATPTETLEPPPPTATLMPTATPTSTPTSGVISGHLFIDQNGNGQQEPDEQGLSGIVIFLLDPATNQPTQYQVVTDASGTFRFVDVMPASYSLGIEMPAEFVPTGALGTMADLRDGSNVSLPGLGLQPTGTTPLPPQSSGNIFLPFIGGGS